jgi:hypothetical protein
MALEGVGKVTEKKSKSRKGEYKQVWIYVPIKVAEDSNFPFKGGEEVKIKINLKRRMLEVSKM